MNTELMDKWYELIYSKLKEGGKLMQMSEEFSNFETNLERVCFTWKLDSVQSTLHVREMFQRKCKEKSISVRSDGNRAFQSKKFSEALSLYNESVRFAPLTSVDPEFSVAVANRSAVLIHMKKYSRCLLDIELALRYNYPAILRYKLYERQGKCYFFLHKLLEALESFEKAQELLETTGLTVEKSNSHCKNLDLWINRTRECLKEKGGKLNEESVNCPIITPILSGGGNDVFPCLSSKVDVTYENEKGRHIKATQEVQVGDVIAVEKPYASVLLPENYQTHCLHCLKRLLVLYPCRQCARVAFCSESCENIAWLYHQYECKYLDFLTSCGLEKFGFLALRVITKTTWSVLTHFDCQKSRKESVLEDGSLSNSIYGNTYFEIYHLVAHTKDRSTSDLFRRSIIAVLLTKCLESAGYFDQYGSRVVMKNILCIASHLLHMLQVLPCNAHEVSEFVQKDKDLVNSHTIEIAAAIYSTFSLFNHSCDPCVTRNFYGDTCVMRAIETVPKDCEVFDNYGYVSAVTPLSVRQNELKKQYYFTCDCLACTESWPLYNELECRIPILKCRRCHERLSSSDKIVERCLFCEEEVNVAARLSEVYDAGACLKVGIDKMIAGDDENALPLLIACIERLDQCVSRPWQDINSCQQGIIQCFNVIQSNKHLLRP